MGSVFSSPPKPKAPEKPPTMQDPAVQDAEARRRRLSARSGRQQTVLTSPTGVATPGYTASKTLLGA